MAVRATWFPVLRRCLQQAHYSRKFPPCEMIFAFPPLEMFPCRAPAALLEHEPRPTRKGIVRSQGHPLFGGHCTGLLPWVRSEVARETRFPEFFASPGNIGSAL